MSSDLYSHNLDAPVASGVINASVELPGSKSLTNRELVLSALAIEPTRLTGALVSRDSALMIAALQQLGAKVDDAKGTSPTVHPATLSADATIDCGLAGTVMRFVPPVSVLNRGITKFDGDEAARRRPMKTTIESLRALGAVVENEDGALPFEVHGLGAVPGGEITIDASSSSQFVSGLLLAAPRFENGITLRHRGEHLPSMPHIEMTLQCLRERGISVSEPEPLFWRVEPGAISGGTKAIEPDLSNAGPFLAAAMVAGGSVTIPGWPTKTTQVGNEFDGILQQLGAQISRDERGLTLTGNGEISGVDIDLSIGGELAPVIAGLATLATTPSRLRGIAHLRGHETDRLSALASEINRIGGDCEETEDGLIIRPSNRLHGGLWHTYEDHRMATTGAIIGLRVPGIEIENIGTTAKTMPNFTQLWLGMLGQN